MTQKSCAVGMRNAILRNHLKSKTNVLKYIVVGFCDGVILNDEKRAFSEQTYPIQNYSRTSCKGPLKMSSLGGHL